MCDQSHLFIQNLAGSELPHLSKAPYNTKVYPRRSVRMPNILSDLY